MYQVQEAFERQKEEDSRRQEMFDNKEEELRARDLAVQEKFVEFSKVINENEAKLQRANNRIEEEVKAINLKKQKKNELETTVNKLKLEASTLEKEVLAMRTYGKFLENVRDKNPEEFTDINDILTLYQKLGKADRDLKQKQKYLEEENQKLRSKKDESEKKKKIDMLGLNIEIAKKSKQYEEIDSKRHELTKDVELSSKNTIDKQVEIGRIFM
jgi:chromosome segregation ATPase